MRLEHSRNICKWWLLLYLMEAQGDFYLIFSFRTGRVPRRISHNSVEFLKTGPLGISNSQTGPFWTSRNLSITIYIFLKVSAYSSWSSYYVLILHIYLSLQIPWHSFCPVPSILSWISWLLIFRFSVFSHYRMPVMTPKLSTCYSKSRSSGNF